MASCLRAVEPRGLCGLHSYELRAGADAELAIDPREVQLHGLGADEQRRAHLPVRPALGDDQGDLALLWCQDVVGRLRPGARGGAARGQLTPRVVGPADSRPRIERARQLEQDVGGNFGNLTEDRSDPNGVRPPMAAIDMNP